MGKERPVRVLVAKLGLDGHDVGAKTIVLALRDAGMEVIYTGLHQSPEMIVRVAVQEGVDVIGLSCLSGAHVPLSQRVTELLEQEGLNDILIIIGGNIPEYDHEILKKLGIQGIFGNNSQFNDIVEFIKNSVKSEQLN